MLIPVRTTQFKRDVKLADKRGKNMSKLTTIMTKLIRQESLEEKHKDHKLSGNYAHHRECHIELIGCSFTV